jgi:nucleotide-binding universal stress UspA family protein
MPDPRVKLLLAVDDSDYSPHVVEVAARLFRGVDLKVTLLSVVEEIRGPGTEVGEKEVMQQERERFKALHGHIANQYFKDGNQVVESLILEGSPADVICERAKSSGADLIVMGTRGRGRMQRAFLGSVSEDVILKSSVPVTVVTKTALSPD